MDASVDKALRECRILLTALRTPKLREQLAWILAAADTNDTADTNASRPIVTGPFAQLSWLGNDGTFSNAELTQATNAIKRLLGDDALLLTHRISDMPTDESERITLLRAIFSRVFENTGRRQRLTESELNARLAMLVEEVALFRRYAVDYGILARCEDGSQYWLA